jgi:tetratricopeptide (TPR) repeat protein
LADKAFNERWLRWSTCSLCERDHHGVVRCALGWACWKTYVGRPETDTSRRFAMTALGNGLCDVEHHADALVVREAELAMERRCGSRRITTVLRMQGNLAGSYEALGRPEEASEQYRQVYLGLMNNLGEEHLDTIGAANNYASSLARQERYAEARSLLHKMFPVARRVLGENDEAWFMMRMNFAAVLYEDSAATLDDVHEAVTTLEDLAPITRRVLGCTHPTVGLIELSLRKARATLLRVRAMALSPAEVERLPPADKCAVMAIRAAQLRKL